MTDIPDEDDHVKEVYARFGLAVYYAQVLEHGLVNALVVLELIPARRADATTRDEWSATVDAFMDRQFETTMGRMMKTLRSVSEVPNDLDRVLADGLRRRNWLAHDFFRQRAESFMTRVGREHMLREVDECRIVFQDADARLDAAIAPLRQRAGLTEEHIQRLYAEMEDSAKHDG